MTASDNLYKAFGYFIEAFRPYSVSLLMAQFPNDWENKFVEVLSPKQKDDWNKGISSGSKPESLIDFHHLRSFAIKHKTLFAADFGKKSNDLPNWLGEIADVRNKIAHFQELEEDEVTKAWIHMKTIAKLLKMDELVHELEALQSGKKAEPKITKGSPVSNEGGTQPWFRIVTPHLDIRQGRLDESVFAANLSEVALGNGREIYSNRDIFFSKTYLTQGLKTVANRVINGLNGDEEAENRVINLQTGFGGGKTHTLITLYHIAKAGKHLGHTGILHELKTPKFNNSNLAVFTNNTNDAANGRVTEDGTTLKTIWGELAWQLGGSKAYQIIKKNDEELIAPGGLFKKVLELCAPALILIDELADYCVKASAKKAGNSSLADQTISFMQELTEAVTASANCVMVLTLPASPEEVGNTPAAQSILNSLQKRVGRISADTLPVADDEIYEVIRRRLFEDAGSEEHLEKVADKYSKLYQEYKVALPANAIKIEYKNKLKKSYPFHPELIDILRVRWASHHDFQRTRGVLRLLAAVVSDLWKRQQSLSGENLLIHTSDLNLQNLDSITSQIKKLYGNGYDAVISSDISGTSSNAFHIDSENKELGDWHLAQGIATTILMNSFGNEGANKGVSVKDIKLNVLKPSGFNHNMVNTAIDSLEARAYYLYYSTTGEKRYWFHTKPNINILINQAKAEVKMPDVESEILKRINEKVKHMQHFNVLVNPSEDIAEQQKLTLIILNPKYLADPVQVNGNTRPLIEKIATKKGNSERIYRNTILFLVCSEHGFSKLGADVREYLSCQKISSEYGNQLEKDQKDEIRRKMDEAGKSTEDSISKAYSIVVKYSAKKGIEKLQLKQFKDSIDSQVNYVLYDTLKTEEWVLENIGLNTLRNNSLLPTLEHPVKAKDIYEAFIRYDDKPMVSGLSVVQDSILKFSNNGEYAIAAGDGKTFNRFFYKELISHFDITDDNYWLVDKSLVPKPEPPVAPAMGSGTQNTGSPYPNRNPQPEPAANEPEQPGVKKFKSIKISGKVPLEHYTDLFQYFISPFVQSGNKIEIEVSFKINSTQSSPLDESKQLYKNAKESVKQLGLSLEEE